MCKTGATRWSGPNICSSSTIWLPESSWKSKKSGSIARHNLRAELTLSRKAGIPRERGVLAETVDAFALRSMASIAISSEEKPARGGVVVVGVRRLTLFSLSITFPSDTW